MRVLVLGPNGYLGSNVMLHVAKKGNLIIENFHHRFNLEDQEVYRKNFLNMINDYEPNLIYNFISAGVYDRNINQDKLLEVNVKYPLFLLETLKNHRTKIIFFGSYLEDKFFKNNHDLPKYVESKSLLLKSLKNDYKDKDVVYLRLPNIFGGINQHSNSLMQNIKKKGKNLIIRNPNNYRNFLCSHILMDFLTSEEFVKIIEKDDVLKIKTVLTTDFLCIKDFVDLVDSASSKTSHFKGISKKFIDSTNWETELIVLYQNIESLISE